MLICSCRQVLRSRLTNLGIVEVVNIQQVYLRLGPCTTSTAEQEVLLGMRMNVGIAGDIAEYRCRSWQFLQERTQMLKFTDEAGNVVKFNVALHVSAPCRRFAD